LCAYWNFKLQAFFDSGGASKIFLVLNLHKIKAKHLEADFGATFYFIKKEPTLVGLFNRKKHFQKSFWAVIACRNPSVLNL
jgi:hypothetical protein